MINFGFTFDYVDLPVSCTCNILLKTMMILIQIYLYFSKLAAEL